MNSVQKVIRQRLTDKGFTEATVSLSGENRVTVEIPQITNRRKQFRPWAPPLS